MNAKEHLKRLRVLDTIIKHRQEELHNVRATLDDTGGTVWNNTGIKSTQLKTDANFVNGVLTAAELEEQISEEIGQLTLEKHRIIGEINGLNDSKHIEVLYKKYVQFKYFDDIAAEMGYSSTHIKRIHRAALAAFEQQYRTA